ncbi:hypothetical protein Trydic_g23215 [Trypoxylus dichotomus]
MVKDQSLNVNDDKNVLELQLESLPFKSGNVSARGTVVGITGVDDYYRTTLVAARRTVPFAPRSPALFYPRSRRKLAPIPPEKKTRQLAARTPVLHEKCEP